MMMNSEQSLYDIFSFKTHENWASKSFKSRAILQCGTTFGEGNKCYSLKRFIITELITEGKVSMACVIIIAKGRVFFDMNKLK